MHRRILSQRKNGFIVSSRLTSWRESNWERGEQRLRLDTAANSPMDGEVLKMAECVPKDKDNPGFLSFLTACNKPTNKEKS